MLSGKNMNNLNKYGNKPYETVGPRPNQEVQYLKETFGLSDQEIAALGNQPKEKASSVSKPKKK